MEASETMTQLPLDFSVTMMNIKIKSELNNNTSMFLSQNNQQSSSAFKVVTPRGKTDGELKNTNRDGGEENEKKETKMEVFRGNLKRVEAKME
jgi:hypothetical protein